MQTKIMTPEHHDLVLAVTSHAPHLIAYTMVGVVDDLEVVTKSEIINYSAEDLEISLESQIDPVMWRDIFLNNQDAHLEVLGRLPRNYFHCSVIRKKDGEYLLKYFERTRSVGGIVVGQDTGTPNFGRDYIFKLVNGHCVYKNNPLSKLLNGNYLWFTSIAWVFHD